MNSNDKYWIAFALLDEFSSNFINKLYTHFGSIKKAWEASFTELKNIKNLNVKKIEKFLTLRDKQDPEKLLNRIYEEDINFIHQESLNYPHLLKHIDNPPCTLFYKGDISLCNFDKCLSVVGSRNVSDYAKRALKHLIDPLKNTDLCIVSGFANGADTQAHKLAIRNNLKTIAVLGSGLNNIYPSGNKKLFEQIIKENLGIVITEYAPQAKPLAWRFPHRNRIVSGLSKGTLVIEAGIKSGAMITANLALEQGRELMCIPGDILNPNTLGIYKLIKNGAGIITSSEDILEILNWDLNISEASNNQIKSKEMENLDKSEKKIIAELQINALTFDELCTKVDISTENLMLYLTTLELKGLIKQVDSIKYIVA